ncbi:MAG: hypothetical protein GSR84_00475 [Desulfurococcales archaeon]|nr:hypothetical protein [Desulfurococcales archaeon]
MEDTIVIVILIGAAIVVSLAAANWVMGLWGGVQEEFMVRPMVYVRYYGTGVGGGATPVLNLLVENKGNAPVKILRIELQVSGGSYVNMTNITVPAKGEISTTITSWTTQGTPTAIGRGDKVRVIIYTDRLDRLFFDVVAS